MNLLPLEVADLSAEPSADLSVEPGDLADLSADPVDLSADLVDLSADPVDLSADSVRESVWRRNLPSQQHCHCRGNAVAMEKGCGLWW